MRRAAASFVVVAGVMLAAGLILPALREAQVFHPVRAQDEAGEANEPPRTVAPAGSQPHDRLPQYQAVAALDRKLSQAVEVDFEKVPLREAVSDLTEQIGAEVIIDKSGIQEEGLSTEKPVTLHLRTTPMSARAALRFLLEPHGLAFATRAGVLFVTTETKAEEILTVKVYNVRDLAERDWLPLEKILGDKSTMDEAEQALLGTRWQPQRPASPSGAKLVNVMRLRMAIMQSTSGPWQVIDGTGGSIMTYDGQLIIRQTDRLHHEIRKLLDGLRAGNRAGPGSYVTMPSATGAALVRTGDVKPALRDLSVLAESRVTPSVRTALMGIRPDGSGEIGQLEILRAVTLTDVPAFGDLPPGQQTMAYQLLRPLGIDRQAWLSAIDRARARDQPLGGLKELLDAARFHAGLGVDIDLSSLLLALLDYREGPIPAVLAHVGLTPERLQQRILKTGTQQLPDFLR